MYPFERFSEHSKAVLTLAQAEAERRGQSFIGTEHLLIGLMRRDEGTAALALRDMGLQLDSVEADIARVITENPSERMPLKHLIPTSRVKRVIEMAFEEARRNQSDHVETGHLLMGLLLEGEGIAARVLVDRGVSVARTREQLEGLRKAGNLEVVGSSRPPTLRPPTPGSDLDLTDENGRHILVTILFPRDYSADEQTAVLTRVRNAIERGDRPGAIH